MTYYNIHSHVFTMKNAPQDFLSLYMPKFAANFIDKITNTEAGAAMVSKILSLGGNGTKRYARFLSIGKSTEEMEVFTTMKDQYGNTDFKFVGLTLYMEDCGAKSSQSGYEGQLEGVLQIKRQYPDQFLIFLGIDPRWKGSATELRKTVEEKFNYRLSVSAGRSVYPYTGLKLYPSTGFYAFDKRLSETFEWAADNGVPVISHCNYLGGIYNNDSAYLKQNLNPRDPYSNKIYNKPAFQQQNSRWRKILGTNASHCNKLTCSYFLEPESFRTLLHYFHHQLQTSRMYLDEGYAAYRRSLDLITRNQRLPLKICLAHYGGDDQIIKDDQKIVDPKPIGISDKNWCTQIKELMGEYECLYTDISYALANVDTHPVVLKDLDNKILGDRILFGTDFFLTEREKPEKEDVGNFQQAAQKQKMTRNPGITCWDQIASRNPEKFLFSKYYNGQVI